MKPQSMKRDRPATQTGLKIPHGRCQETTRVMADPAMHGFVWCNKASWQISTPPKVGKDVPYWYPTSGEKRPLDIDA